MPCALLLYSDVESDTFICIDAILAFVAFPTYSIRVPRVMLSIQTRYTSTASKVDNDKQIPQLLLIVLSSCSTIVVLQQSQESAVVITSRNNRNPVATYIQSQPFKTQNDVVITNSNDVVTYPQLVLPLYSKKPAADRFLIPTADFATIVKTVSYQHLLFINKTVYALIPRLDNQQIPIQRNQQLIAFLFQRLISQQ
ncbi:hypothetical protein F511_28324 [Dorcoceras hygrometricum]|uniref:Uncharacterized protein n=1 Tax=Dorcoceras hygrometricum TaxID=472368 RepID=A0A2Z7AK47_9LAMI|nr:hypothetical protein F511_28324 [Dorcoceras hygrometricum]